MALPLSRLTAALIARRRTLAVAALRFWPHPWPVSPHPRATNAIGSPSILHGNRSLFSARLFSSSAATADGSPSSSPSPQDLIITDNCVKRLQEIMQEEKNKGEDIMLRVSVEGGGCSGFQYIFALENKQGSSDRVFEKDGVKVVVDNISMDFIKGATIDYIEELIRTSFMVTQNPNASGGCGCGSSFNVK